MTRPTPPQIKLPEEVSIQQYCNDIGSAAHVEAMRYVKVGVSVGVAAVALFHELDGCKFAPLKDVINSVSYGITFHADKAQILYGVTGVSLPNPLLVSIMICRCSRCVVASPVPCR